MSDDEIWVTTECPAPHCGAALVLIAPTQIGPKVEPNAKPVEARCVHGHEFPVWTESKRLAARRCTA